MKGAKSGPPFFAFSRKPEIENMGRNDQNQGKREQKQLIIVPILLREQENHASCKKQKRNKTAVMPPEAMSERQGSDQEGQHNHAGLKPEIMDDIRTKYRECGQKKG